MVSRFRAAKVHWSEVEAPSVARPKRPGTRLNGSYGHPVHPALVTVPIGAWTAAVVFDLASLRVDDAGAFATGAYWLLVIGLVGAALAAVFGGMDLHGVPRRTRAFRTGLRHVALTLGASTLFAVSLALRDASPGEDAPPPAAVELSAAGLVVLLAGGFLGGRLAYHYGVRVADESTQAEGFVRRADRRLPGA